MTVEGVRDEAFLVGLPDDALVGIGRVARFVPSPDAEFRGYDVNVETRVTGFRPIDVTMFVRVADRLPGVDGGDRVVIVGRRGELPALLVAAGCPILTPLQSAASDEG